MPREEEPHRAPVPPPRGCVVAFLIAVGLFLLLVTMISIGTEPRYPGADPF